MKVVQAVSRRGEDEVHYDSNSEIPTGTNSC